MIAEPHSPSLRPLIQEHFALEELRMLCFDLGIDYEELGEGIGKSVRTVNLLQHVRQQGRLDELLSYLRQARPKVAWPDQLSEVNLGLEAGRLVNVPPLPPHFLPRETELAALRQKVLADSTASVGITGQSKTVGVQGMGGIGKSVLAAALAHDTAVRAAFPDGIYWLELGQTPNLLLRQSQLAEALGDGSRAFEDTQQGKARLSQLLAGQTCLVILDDVWQMAQAQVLDGVSGSSGGSRLLITARDRSLLTGLGAAEHRLDVLNEFQALALLADWAGQAAETLPAVAHQVVQRCDYLPLALSLCGAQVRDGLAWEDVLAALAEADLTFLDHAHGSVMASMHLSVAALPPSQRELYQLLAAVPEDTAIPEAALVGLWAQVGHLNQRQCRQLLTQLENKSLLRLRGENGKRVAHLHDLQHLYLRQQTSMMSLLHEQWLAAYATQCPNGWPSGPDDGYFFEHLAHHLQAAGRDNDLRQLLLTFAWLQARLEATDVTSLVQDYDWLAVTVQRADALWLVQGALRLSAHILAQDKNQLAGQLLGRLLSLPPGNEALEPLLAAAREWRRPGLPGLYPLHGNLTPPGGPLLRTLTGHSEFVKAVAVTPDGRLALSGTDDGMVNVWEIATGRELRTFRGHGGWVKALAVTPDGRLALSGSHDRTVKVWDIATGQEHRTFQGHRRPVKALAVTPDGRLALSGSEDHTVKVWEIASGLKRRTFQGHRRPVNAVAVTPDGRLALSADNDTTKVWEIASGQELRTLAGDTDWVKALAVTPDGRLVLSASEDGAVTVWEIATGQEIRTFAGDADEVHALAVTPDGRLALSASEDGAVTVWEIATGQEIRTFAGHPERVNAVAVTPDGRLALSASDDATVKVWEIVTGRERRTFAGHTYLVSAVAVTPDGRLALSGSWDNTVKVWAIATGRERRTFEGHTLEVNAVAVTPDGRLALSASEDGTVKVWAIATGRERRTFEGHTWTVRTLAVTSDGRLALSGSWDNTVKVWEIATGRERRTFEGHTGGVNVVTVTPDGRLALSVTDDTMKVWEIATGQERRTFESHAGGVKAVAVTPAGRLALSASEDATVKVWDIATGQNVVSFQAEQPFSSLSLTTDGLTVVAGDESGRIHFFRLTVPSL